MTVLNTSCTEPDRASVASCQIAKYCAVPGCGRTQSLHNLPSDSDSRNAWLKFIFKDVPAHVGKTLSVCSLHFNADFLGQIFPERLRLKSSAVPSILDPIGMAQQSYNKEIYKENVMVVNGSQELFGYKHFSEYLSLFIRTKKFGTTRKVCGICCLISSVCVTDTTKEVFSVKQRHGLLGFMGLGKFPGPIFRWGVVRVLQFCEALMCCLLYVFGDGYLHDSNQNEYHCQPLRK